MQKKRMQSKKKNTNVTLNVNPFIPNAPFLYPLKT